MELLFTVSGNFGEGASESPEQVKRVTYEPFGLKCQIKDVPSAHFFLRQDRIQRIEMVLSCRDN